MSDTVNMDFSVAIKKATGKVVIGAEAESGETISFEISPSLALFLAMQIGALDPEELQTIADALERGAKQILNEP